MKINTKLPLMMVCLGLLAACDSNSNNNSADAIPTVPAPAPPPVMQDFEVEIVNLTAGQIFSPIALVAHDSNYSAFQLGDVASVGLEVLAEGGDNTDFLAEADANASVTQTLSTTGPIMPGARDVISLSINENDVPGTLLSFVTMLINSNDAMTAAHSLAIDSLLVGETLTVTTISYDSGTEANSENVGTIPGPADGGEGFNPMRDDVMDVITGHGGVVTSDDGLTTSVLTEINRWDNPVARVSVRRML